MIAWLFLLAAAQGLDTAEKATETLAATCLDRKFETTIQVRGANGKPRPSKVKLCGKPGQSPAEWLDTLRDAAAKVAADAAMAPATKRQIVSALNAEIARLEPAAKAEAQVPAAPRVVAAPAAPPLSAPPVPAPMLAKGPEIDKAPQYSTYAPLPAPRPATAAPVAAAAVAVPTLPAPRITLRCTATTAIGPDGPCDLLEREMLLTVRAEENVPGGTSLRFVRRGDNRAEVALAALRRGQSQRFSLPPRVCQGVSGSRVEIQVVRTAASGPQVVDTHGPVELRC